MYEGKDTKKPVKTEDLGEALDAAMGIAFGPKPAKELFMAEGPGTLVGRYKLLEQIGEGGFGVVYMAEQQEPIHRHVALKIIKLGMDTSQVVARFEVERQALALMDHANIAGVLDAGSTETGRPFFVMELVRGVAITKYCNSNRLNTHERLELFVAVCNAVQHAHQKGIIHRDLKPSNVMVTLRDGMPVPKVIDFGVAKATQARLTEMTLFTHYGQFIGTPAYMSPEQVGMNELNVDTRSDIYSLGVMLYELLTGSTPFDQKQLRSAGYSEMQRIIREDEPPIPSTRLSRSGEALAVISAERNTEPKKLNRLLRGDLDWIVMNCLEKDRTRRYETANDLAADVKRYLNHEPVAASPPSTVYKLRKFASKYRRLLATAAMLFGIMLLGTVVSILLTIRAWQAESLADQLLINERIATQNAEKLGVDLTNQLLETDRAVKRARHLLYVAHMNLIQQELLTGNDSRVIELLENHRPANGQRDLRGFEWYHAWGVCNRNPWNWQHHTSVESVDYSPDGKLIASGCSDGSLQVWNAESGKILSTVNGHGSIVFDVAFSPDGKMILSGSKDQTAKLWAFESGMLKQKSLLIQHSAPIQCVAFSMDGTNIATGSGDHAKEGELKLWNLKTDAQRTLDRQKGAVLSLAFSHDGKSLASSSTKNIEIWDVESTKLTRTVESNLQSINAMAYSPVNTTLVLGDSKGQVELWNDKTGIRRLGRHTGMITDLVYSSDGEMIASSATDSLIFLWDVENAEKADTLRGHANRVNSISFSPNSKNLISASADNTLKMWDLTRGQARLNLASHVDSVGSVTFSPTERHTLASGSLDGTVQLWNLENAKVTTMLPPYGGPVRCVAYSPNGKIIAYGGGPLDQPADVVFWDAEHRTVKRTGKIHSRAVLAIAFSPDGNTLASGGDDGVLALWDVGSASLKTKLENHSPAVVSLAYSPDGKLLATSNFHQNKITIWNVDNPSDRRVLEGHRDWVTSVTFSPDSSLLASGSVDNTVRIWDVATSKEKFEMVGHSLRVTSVEFSPENATVASISQDDQLKLWDIATGQEKATLDCQPEMAGDAIAFSLDGRTLAAAGNCSVILHRAVSDQDLFLDDEPEVPRNHHLPASSVVNATSVSLKASQFFHKHTDVTHVASHWQLRSAEESYTVPVVNHVDPINLTTLKLQRGLVAPNTTYFWRVAYVGSNHKTTSFSSETSFTTDNFPIKIVPFDLTPHFNRDIIKNPGDSETDSIDTSHGSHLTVEGFDGNRSNAPHVHGLPRNAKVGVHALGDYSKHNAIQTGLNDEDKKPIHVSIPPGGYHLVRFLVVGGNGNSDMPVRFHYANGTTQKEVIRCDDWFHDLDVNRYGLLRTGLLPIINEMDRFYDNIFRDDNEPAIFEVIMKVDPTKQMISFELETDGDQVQYTDTALIPDHSRVRFNLLAATGVIAHP